MASHNIPLDASKSAEKGRYALMFYLTEDSADPPSTCSMSLVSEKEKEKQVYSVYSCYSLYQLCMSLPHSCPVS